MATPKRHNYSKKEKEIFKEILICDREAQKYILNKEIIRATEKEELYERVPLLGDRTIKHKQFWKRCADIKKT